MATSVKDLGVRFNSSKTTTQALANNATDEGKGTIHFTTDGDIVLNGTNFTPIKSIAQGSANGTISVNGTDVSVKGLGSAAYTQSAAYATSTQGGKADTAVQTIQIGGTAQTKTNGMVNLPAYPTTLPASDVSAWAKKSSLAVSDVPTLTPSKVGLGNVTNDAQVKRTEMGVANGVATLDANGTVPSSQLPSFVDDVIEGYLYNGKFYKESAHTTQIAGEGGKIYVDLATNKTYRWGGSAFAVISDTIAIGTTAGTAYDGAAGAALKTKLDGIAAGATNVTESTVSGWGFTKNTGTYSKPSGGIPATDLASAVQTNITNGATAYGWGNHASAGYVKTTALADWAKANTKPTYNASELKLSANYAKASTGSTSFTAGTTTIESAIGSLAKAIDGKTSNTGTVTSVGVSVPTGLSVSGTPITTSGTIAITLASGYSIPTTAKQTSWDGKQNAISDLDTIRTGAANGTTALAACAALIWD